MTTKIRSLSIVLFAVIAAGAAIMYCASARASAAGTSTVPVVACRTILPFQGPPPKIPSQLRVQGNPKTVNGLTAYSNYYTYLIGPSGLACKGADGVDGSSSLIAWERGTPEPRRRSAEPGLTLNQVPACVGCMADMLCPFLPRLADRIFLDIACTAAIPRGEIVRTMSGNLVRFTDPPYVGGDGDPSAGPFTAEGAVGYGGERRGTFETTCTLPDRQRWVCRASLNDVIARYG